MQNFTKVVLYSNTQTLYDKILLLLVGIFLLILIPTVSFAQVQTTPLVNATISGKVIDGQTKEALPGAVVQLEGVTHSVPTDENGEFRFVTGQKLPATLIVSYLGYEKLTVIVTNSPITIQLKESNNLLNDVVVVAYGTQERRNIIGAVSKIDPSDAKGIPAGSFDSQLQGKVPGVQISTNTGVPGSAINVRVRGASSINASNNPLFVVDGVFMNNSSLQTYDTGGKSTSPIADINPSDIESISVLKDAEATVLYGVRGANGVILITTKRGKYNQKPKLNFNVTQGWSKAEKLWNLTTGPEHAILVNENYINTGGSFATRPFRPVAEGGRGLPEEQETYDRLGEVFRTAQLQNYDVSLTGGTNGSRYYFAAGYNKQESILAPISFDRASLKANFDQKLSNNVTIGISNTFSRTFRNEARAGDGPQGGLLQAALHTPTYLSPYNDDGVLVGRAGFDNVTLLLDNYDVNSASLRYIGNLYAEAELLPGLTFRSSFGADYNNYDESEYWNTFLIAGSPNGLATSSIGQRSSLLNEQTLAYRKTINDHSFGVLVGNTLQSDTYKRTSGRGTGFANNSFKSISSAAVTSSSDSWSKRNLASFFTRLDYNYAGKYLVNFSLRADGSSAFGKDKRWGYFPGVGAAWQVKQENFLKDVDWITDLKLRTSYGITGNQDGSGDFSSLGLWQSGGASYQNLPGISPQQLGNANLGWEETAQFNIGLDFSILQNRLAIELNYYDKYTSGGILQTPLAGTTGFPNYTNNGIEISNKGFEFNINTINVQKENFSWTTNLNIASNVNKIEKLPYPVKFGSRDLILQQEGSSLGSFWVYKELYVDPQTGNSVYEDVDGNNVITVADRQIYGNIFPKFFGGLTNNLTYKSFDLNAFFSFSYGNKVYNHNRFFGEAGGARDAARIIFASNNDRWQNVGDITDTPRPDGINNNNYKDGGSRWLEDGSFLRLRSLTLGYNLPKTVSQKVKLDNVRIFVIGSNLLTLTKYTSLDPESSSSGSQNAQGIDLGTPPQPRGLQFGINVTL